jgi:hypothetical protein
MPKSEELPMRTKRISADEAHELRKDQMRQGADGSELMMKAAKGPSTWDSGSRSARFVMSSQSVDRMGDVVVTAGLDITEFEQNPIALMSHRSDTWPIGTWKNVEKMLRTRPPRMEGDLSFLKAGGPNPEVDTAAWYAENGYVRGASIGFIPDFDQIEMMLDEDGSWTGGLQFNAAKILECSLCAIPANQDALAKAFNGDRGLAKEWLEDVLDNWQRSPEGVLMPRAEFEKAYRILAHETADEENESEPPIASSETLNYLSGLDKKILFDFAERELAKSGKVIVDQSRVESIERAAKQKRLDEQRARERLLREEKIELLKHSG